MSSDEASSRVTYTSISSDYEEPSDAGSPRVIVYGYDGLPMYLVDPYVEVALQAPPSLDYVPGHEEPEQAPPSPDYVPGPEYPEYLALSDVEIPIEDQPYAVDASRMALSPGYIPDSDPEDESEDGPTDYPADEGDDDDDDDSFGDDADDEDEEEEFEEDEKEEEDHLSPTDFTVVAPPTVDHIPSAEKTESFETYESTATQPPPAYRTTSRMSVRSQAPISFPFEAEIPSPPLLVPSPPTTSPTYAEAPLGYRAAGFRLRTASPLPLSSPPLPPPSSPLLIPSTDHRANIPEAVLLPQKRLCLASGPRFEVGVSSFAAAARPTGGYRADYRFIGTLDAEFRRDQVSDMGYGIIDVWEDPTEATEEVPSTTMADLSQRVTDLITTVRDRQYHLNTAMLVESKARVARRHGRSLWAVTQLIKALGRIDTLEAREPAHTDDPVDADICS
nr:hypothetical protein [Tanacetum cinerariifolium]